MCHVWTAAFQGGKKQAEAVGEGVKEEKSFRTLKTEGKNKWAVLCQEGL